MDINCTHSCAYQHEGKCTLRELPAFTQSQGITSGTDCPYFLDGYAS